MLGNANVHFLTCLSVDLNTSKNVHGLSVDLTLEKFWLTETLRNSV